VTPVFRLARRLVLPVALALVVGGCATAEGPEGGQPNALRVGVTSTYPPMIFKQGGGVAGVEADLARRLGQELGRPIRFVELRWEDQIPALLSRQTDIIMSGMSITEARKVRIAFSDPYFKGGLVTAMRTEDSPRYGSKTSILNTSATVGVIEGTTGDVFVQRNFPNARRVALSRASDGALALKRRSIDLFVHDAPALVWLVSENEADLRGFWEMLNEEYLAWGVRPDDHALLVRVNGILGTWKRDGTLNGTLARWLPYLRLSGRLILSRG
jgi:ABC-type amino acid transport substrate-binding protein